MSAVSLSPPPFIPIVNLWCATDTTGSAAYAMHPAVFYRPGVRTVNVLIGRPAIVSLFSKARIYLCLLCIAFK